MVGATANLTVCSFLVTVSILLLGVSGRSEGKEWKDASVAARWLPHCS